MARCKSGGQHGPCISIFVDAHRFIHLRGAIGVRTRQPPASISPYKFALAHDCVINARRRGREKTMYQYLSGLSRENPRHSTLEASYAHVPATKQRSSRLPRIRRKVRAVREQRSLLAAGWFPNSSIRANWLTDSLESESVRRGGGGGRNSNRRRVI